MYPLNNSQINKLSEKCDTKMTEKTNESSSYSNDDIVKNYIQKIINLTNTNCFIWKQPDSFNKVYECKYLDHVLKFEHYVESCCHLIVDNVRYDEYNSKCNSILHSLSESIVKQINITNKERFIEKLSFLDKI